MKNIMIIDGAMNCAYDLFQISDEKFKCIFPAEGQNIEFIEDVWKRYTGFDEAYANLFDKFWDNPVIKEKVSGIHGILFYQLEKKREVYPNKRDSDIFRGK